MLYPPLCHHQHPCCSGSLVRKWGAYSTQALHWWWWYVWVFWKSHPFSMLWEPDIFQWGLQWPWMDCTSRTSSTLLWAPDGCIWRDFLHSSSCQVQSKGFQSHSPPLCCHYPFSSTWPIGRPLAQCILSWSCPTYSCRMECFGMDGWSVRKSFI